MSVDITEMYAILARDDDGIEGIVAEHFNGVWVALVAADEDGLEQIKPMAQRLATKNGDIFEIVKFTTRAKVGEIKP